MEVKRSALLYDSQMMLNGPVTAATDTVGILTPAC